MGFLCYSEVEVMLFDGEDIGSFDVRSFVDRVFDGSQHSKRIDSIANAALGVISSGSLIVHRIGCGLAAAEGLIDKHAVKQVDRLLSNKKFYIENSLQKWIAYAIGARKEIKVTMDWTDFDHDKQSTIMLSLVTKHGRATPLAWKTIDKNKLKNKRNNYEDEVLLLLYNSISRDVKVTIIADRGFCDIKLFDFLKNELNFEYIIRMKSNISVISSEGESRKAIDWVGIGGKTKTLRGTLITASKYAVPTVICTKAKLMKQAWCIACSDPEISGSMIVQWYAKRWGCETQFRDTKDLHFGMGLSSTRIRSKEKRDRILFIAALSIAILTLLGAAGEAIGMDRHLKVNTVKKRTLSLFKQGCRFFRKLFKMPKKYSEPLLLQFNKEILNHAKLVKILGII
ncbi:MAG: IS4 family transposase [Legionellales bacterium]|nr:MAG: IS4 family transposase [Legionellales bacterium]